MRMIETAPSAKSFADGAVAFVLRIVGPKMCGFTLQAVKGQGVRADFGAVCASGRGEERRRRKSKFARGKR